MTDKWRKLSRIDVSDGVGKKGNLDYLSWSFAWSRLMDHYPDSTFYFGQSITYPDGSMMVSSGVTVDGVTHEMQLPVMDHRNKAITNPNARDVNDAQMRCLVKAIALHGVGIGLYLGSFKGAVSETLYDKAAALIDAGDSMGFHAFINTLSEHDQIELFNSAPPGKKSSFKASHRAMVTQAESYFKEVVEAIGDALEKEDELLLEETLSELSTYERGVIWSRLNSHQQDTIRTMRAK